MILPWSPQPKRMSRGKPKRYSSDKDDEEGFNRALDANPNDHHTRMVFADWLQDRNDPRAEGYRALGQLRKTAFRYRDNDGGTPRDTWLWGHDGRLSKEDTHRANYLTPDWLAKIPVDITNNTPLDEHWREHATRREADDKAATAFGQLPEERKAKILQPKKLSRKRVVIVQSRAKGGV